MFNSSIESRREILQRLMSSKTEFSIELIEEFCEDFDFYLNDCLLLYLKMSLKNWNPTINEITGKLILLGIIMLYFIIFNLVNFTYRFICR